jgi:hypothetical protein
VTLYNKRKKNVGVFSILHIWLYFAADMKDFLNKYASRFWTPDIFLLLLICAENYILFFYSINLGQQWLNAGCYFLSSLLFGFTLLGKFHNKEVTYMLTKPQAKTWVPILILTVAFLTLIAFADQYVFQKYSINAKQSDVIPTIQILTKRWLEGTFVYQPIEDFGYHLPVTYMPLQWIVYTPASYFGFDFRWIAFIIWAAGSFWLITRAAHQPNRMFCFFIPMLLFGVYSLTLYKALHVVSTTVEMMVAGYYIILIITLNQKNAVLLGIGFALCLLSRFSLVLWLPLWAWVMWLSNSRKSMFITMGTTAVLVLLIYILPFLSKNWNAFFDGYNYYSKAAIGEWQSLNFNIMKPQQLNMGVGIAFWFAEHYPHHPELGLKLLQRTQLIVCLLTVVGLGIWYWRKRDTIHQRIFLLASFKIYLSIFLFFIQVPYIYLMVVANFVSIAIFSEQLRYRSTKKIKPAERQNA